MPPLMVEANVTAWASPTQEQNRTPMTGPPS
jgi:hypothetical protein